MTKTNKKETTKKVPVITYDPKDYSTKSAAIRDLTSKGFSRSEIAKVMNIRYQHVRNVLITPLMRDQKKDTK